MNSPLLVWSWVLPQMPCDQSSLVSILKVLNRYAENLPCTVSWHRMDSPHFCFSDVFPIPYFDLSIMSIHILKKIHVRTPWAFWWLNIDIYTHLSHHLRVSLLCLLKYCKASCHGVILLSSGRFVQYRCWEWTRHPQWWHIQAWVWLQTAPVAWEMTQLLRCQGQ